MSVANVLKAFKGVFCNDQSDPTSDLEDLLSDYASSAFKGAADGAAGDTGVTYFSFKAPFALRLIACDIIPGAALTAHDTNNAVLTLAKADGAGGSATTMASMTTNTTSGNWVADTLKSLTLSATFANTLVAEGQIVTLKKTIGGTGVVVPISGYTLRWRKV